MSYDFTVKAALALAPSFREKYDFTDEAHYKSFSDQVWKTAKALAAGHEQFLTEQAVPVADKPAKKGVTHE